jgi:hypothetical protein
MDELRPGTRARLYEQHFRAKDFPVHLFALAIGADSGGRLDRQAEGDAIARKVEADVESIRRRCGEVDVGKLWELHGQDQERFTAARHEAWARALR